VARVRAAHVKFAGDVRAQSAGFSGFACDEHRTPGGGGGPGCPVWLVIQRSTRHADGGGEPGTVRRRLDASPGTDVHDRKRRLQLQPPGQLRGGGHALRLHPGVPGPGHFPGWRTRQPERVHHADGELSGGSTRWRCAVESGHGAEHDAYRIGHGSGPGDDDPGRHDAASLARRELARRAEPRAVARRRDHRLARQSHHQADRELCELRRRPFQGGLVARRGERPGVGR